MTDGAIDRRGLATRFKPPSAIEFMLYFAVLSVVTPPVALAAFAAAPIAGAQPMVHDRLPVDRC